MRRLIPVFILASALMACGSEKTARIDGTSKLAAEKSIADLKGALPPEDQVQFQAAIDMGWPLSAIAGKTPDEVIVMARGRKIDEAKASLPVLQEKAASAAKSVEVAHKNEATAKRFLSALELHNPQLVWRPDTQGNPQPLFSFNLKNGTSEAIKTIIFRASVGAPGIATPWIDERFTFQFPDPVTTGEMKFVFVTPDLSAPGNINAQESRVIPDRGYAYQVDFVRVEDVNKRAIMDDEGVARAEADLQAAKDALAAAEAEIKRLEAGGALVP